MMQLLTITPTQTTAKTLLGEASDTEALLGLSVGSGAEPFANVLTDALDSGATDKEDMQEALISAANRDSAADPVQVHSLQFPQLSAAAQSKAAPQLLASPMVDAVNTPRALRHTLNPTAQPPANADAESGKSLPVAGKSLPARAHFLAVARVVEGAPEMQSLAAKTQPAVTAPKLSALAYMELVAKPVAAEPATAGAHAKVAGAAVAIAPTDNRLTLQPTNIRPETVGSSLIEKPSAQLPTAQAGVHVSPVTQAQIGQVPEVRALARSSSQDQSGETVALQSRALQPTEVAVPRAPIMMGLPAELLPSHRTTGAAAQIPKVKADSSTGVPLDLSKQAVGPITEIRGEMESTSSPIRLASRTQDAAGYAALPLANSTAAQIAEGATVAIADIVPSNRGSGPVSSNAQPQAGTAEGMDIAGLVDRLVESRVQARADRPQMEFQHAEFGRVTLALGLQAEGKVSIDLPGAQSELRQAVGQALGQVSVQAANPSGRNDSPTSGSASSSTDAQPSSERQQSETRDGARQSDHRQDHRHERQNRQHSEHRSAANFHSSDHNPAAKNRRGILA